MLNGIHGHQDIERVVYGKPAGAAVRAEAERLGAHRVFVTTTKSVAQSALLAGIIRTWATAMPASMPASPRTRRGPA